MEVGLGGRGGVGADVESTMDIEASLDYSGPLVI